MKTRVGVISDTHGLLRPEALQALARCDRIIHAGDVGAPEILDRLRAIAPVATVRGNIDRGAWAEALPSDELVSVGETSLYVLHDVHDLDLDPVAAGIQAVISGHSHQPSIRHERGVLYLNPGSAGPRRFRLPVTLALLEISGRELQPRLITLGGVS
jgi:putative phosphoesterase